MRLALLHYTAPPIVGGVESVIAHHARMMAQHGHEVRVVAGRGGQFHAGVQFVHVPLADSRHTEVLAVKTQLDRGEVGVEFFRLRDVLVEELQRALKDVDVLFAHNVCSLNKNLALTAALFALHNAGAAFRLVLWHHDLAWTTPRYRAELREGYPWDLLRIHWPGAVQVTISQTRREELAELLHVSPEVIRVIPNGLDLSQFYKLEQRTVELIERIGVMEASPILLLPVRITPRKNIEFALRTLAALRRDWPSAALVVTGPLGAHNPANKSYFTMLRALRSALGLDGAAHFLVELSESTLPDAVISDFYRLADALFLPSREEGFGLPLIEAALSRIPIFCSDIAPLRALGQDDVQHYFSLDDPPEAVAALVKEALQHNAIWRFAHRVRAHYTWRGLYENYIAPLLSQHPPACAT
ncbi:MAG: glycosyltransferase family 4 protein [Thermoflexales bacterium]